MKKLIDRLDHAAVKGEDVPDSVGESYLKNTGNFVFFKECIIQSTLGFATMGKAANLCLATRNSVTDLF